MSKSLHDPDNHDGVITDLEPDILEREVQHCTLNHLHSSLWLRVDFGENPNYDGYLGRLCQGDLGADA